MDDKNIIKSLEDLKEEVSGTNKRLSALIALSSGRTDDDFKLEVFLSELGIEAPEVAAITGKSIGTIYVSKSKAKNSKKKGVKKTTKSKK